MRLDDRAHRAVDAVRRSVESPVSSERFHRYRHRRRRNQRINAAVVAALVAVIGVIVVVRAAGRRQPSVPAEQASAGTILFGQWIRTSSGRAGSRCDRTGPASAIFTSSPRVPCGGPTGAGFSSPTTRTPIDSGFRFAPRRFVPTGRISGASVPREIPSCSSGAVM